MGCGRLPPTSSPKSHSVRFPTGARPAQNGGGGGDLGANPEFLGQFPCAIPGCGISRIRDFPEIGFAPTPRKIHRLIPLDIHFAGNAQPPGEFTGGFRGVRDSTGDFPGCWPIARGMSGGISAWRPRVGGGRPAGYPADRYRHFRPRRAPVGHSWRNPLRCLQFPNHGLSPPRHAVLSAYHNRGKGAHISCAIFAHPMRRLKKGGIAAPISAIRGRKEGLLARRRLPMTPQPVHENTCF